MSIAVKTDTGWQVLGAGSGGGGSFDPAPVISAPVSVNGPDVQTWPVRDKEGNQKVVYFLPGNTGTGTPEPEAIYSVALGAGVLPGVMVGSGGCGGSASEANRSAGGGGAGGVIGQGAHVPVILPVQGTATYTIKVGSTTPNGGHIHHQFDAQSTTIEVQGQTPFVAAMGGGMGTCSKLGYAIQASMGGSGGGAGSWPNSGNDAGLPFVEGALGLPGQGNQGGESAVGGSANSGGGGGYGSRPNGGNGGDGFDLATALNLDDTDGPTKTFLDIVSVDGFIAGGGIARGGTTSMGGAGSTGGGHAKDYTGSGGAWSGNAVTGIGGAGGAGAVYIITDAP